MPTLNQTQTTHIEALQDALAAAKTALDDVADAAQVIVVDMLAVNTLESLEAGNAAGQLKGTAISLRGQLIREHYLQSNALLKYDGTNGPDIVVNGPGR